MQVQLDKLIKGIKTNNSHVWIPKDINLVKQVNTNGVKVLKYVCENNFNHKLIFKHNVIKDEELYKCKTVDLHLNISQKNIIKRWLWAYFHMYNETIKFHKNRFKNNLKTEVNFQIVRTQYLKIIRDRIQSDSHIDSKKRIKTHMLDEAIKLACSNYKSALANFKNGNIKYFKLRYWRTNKPTLRVDIEKSYIRRGTICKMVLGDILATYDGKPFDLQTIESTCQIHYNKEFDKFYLYVPEKLVIKNLEMNNRKEWISIDPGVRKFMTGMSSNEVIEIGDNSTNIIMKHHKKIDYYNKITMKTSKKNKAIKRCRRKIKGYVDNLHLQSANLLTKNYKTILIGDLSAKRCLKSDLNKNTKRVMQSLSFYRFRERLLYKGIENKSNVQIINEAYTSQTCSQCTHRNLKLGSDEVYNCVKCNLSIDRDVNGSRCILLKSIM